MVEYLTTFTESILAMGWSDSHVRFRHYTTNSIPNPPIKCNSIEWVMHAES